MFWKIALLSKNCLTYVLLYNGPIELIFSFFQVCSKNFLISPLSDGIIIFDELIEQLLSELQIPKQGLNLRRCQIGGEVDDGSNWTSHKA